jgi:hypothetical protein
LIGNKLSAVPIVAPVTIQPEIPQKTIGMPCGDGENQACVAKMGEDNLLAF